MINKREKILKATLEIIDEVGLQSAAISQIIKKSDVGIGTLYNYFPSKEVLVSELYKKLTQSLINTAFKNVKTDINSKEKFKQIILGFIEFGLNNQAEFRFIQNYCNSPYLTEEAFNSQNEIFELINSVYKEIKSSYKIKDITSKLFVKFISGALEGAISGQLYGHYIMTDKEIDAILQACWDAFVNE